MQSLFWKCIVISSLSIVIIIYLSRKKLNRVFHKSRFSNSIGIFDWAQLGMFDDFTTIDLEETIGVTPHPEINIPSVENNNMDKTLEESYLSNMSSPVVAAPEDQYVQVFPGAVVNPSNKSYKLILYYTKWFGQNWTPGRFREPELLQEDRCPYFNCEFTYDKDRFEEADAILFGGGNLATAYNIRDRRLPHQRFLFIHNESPAGYPMSIMGQKQIHTFNWTFTYATKSDVIAANGYFQPLNCTTSPLRTNLMDYESETMKSYMKDLNTGMTLEGVMGSQWLSFVNRSKSVAWMSSHCQTNSKREIYLNSLSEYVNVDKYGKCGTIACLPKGPRTSYCWEEVLGPKYLFYMAMENNLCEDYVTEKAYMPLRYGLVPIFWGGANYTQRFPPNSFIDARKYKTKELADLIIYYQNNPVQYGRLHLWRKYWEVHVGSNFCELCYKLNVDKTRKSYAAVKGWKRAVASCNNRSANISYYTSTTED